MGKTVAEVESSIEQIKIANEFLIHTGKKDFWHDLRGMELRQDDYVTTENECIERKERPRKTQGILFQSYERGRDNTKGTKKRA